MTQPDDRPPAFAAHDHSHCAGSTLSRAEAVAADRRVRLTPVRRRALEILLEAHRAMGAYEVLERLAAEGFGHQPPVAYRALEFLVDNGLAHRIRRLNAFAACMHPGSPAASATVSQARQIRNTGACASPGCMQAAKAFSRRIRCARPLSTRNSNAR